MFEKSYFRWCLLRINIPNIDINDSFFERTFEFFHKHMSPFPKIIFFKLDIILRKNIIFAHFHEDFFVLKFLFVILRVTFFQNVRKFVVAFVKYDKCS